MFNGRNITISINQRELRGWVNPVKPYRENYTSRDCRATCSNKKNFLRGFKAKKKKKPPYCSKPNEDQSIY